MILVATVHLASEGDPVESGRVRFSVVSPTPEAIGSAHLNKLGNAAIVTSRLNDGEPHEIQAQFVPSGKAFATSYGSVSVSVAPAEATSFRIRAPQFFGAREPR